MAGGLKRLDLSKAAAERDRDTPVDDLIALDEALERLSEKSKIKADLVKLRYFAGMTIEQTAKVLGISTATAKRYWTYARAWLIREIS